MEQTLGKRIVKHRKKLGLTQDQLAEKLGVTAQAVSKWENDQSCPDIYMLPKLADLFGITTDDLLGRPIVLDCKPEDAEEESSGWEFHWDSNRRSGICFATFVLLVGSLLFAAKYNGWPADLWDIVWPSALLVFGLSALPRKFHFTNLACALLGGYFLIDNLEVLNLSAHKKLIFPALILLCGLGLLLDALRKPKKGRFHIHKKGDIAHKTSKHFVQDDDWFSCDLSFGEVTHQITLPQLSRGEAHISFGEMTIDLSGCGEILNGCELDVSASFGSFRLNVPKAYRVECAAGTSFGDISVHGQPDDQPLAIIKLTGSVSFGDIEIHYV